MTSSHQRRQELLKHLAENESSSIQELAGLLSVSTMTIHRDLDKLAENGSVIKVHGGAILRPTAAPAGAPASTCPMCQQGVREQLAFVLQFNDGSQKQACCPHCGLMMLNMQDPVVILATDFLYGNKVNALQAIYLINPDLKTCCSPAVVAFSFPEDAVRFKKGFGGKMASFTEAKDFLSSTHTLPRNM